MEPPHSNESVLRSDGTGNCLAKSIPHKSKIPFNRLRVEGGWKIIINLKTQQPAGVWLWLWVPPHPPTPAQEQLALSMVGDSAAAQERALIGIRELGGFAF